MKSREKAVAPKPRPVSDWTLERVSRLQRQEIEQLRENGRALGAGPEALDAHIRAEIARWNRVLTAAGVQPTN